VGHVFTSFLETLFTPLTTTTRANSSSAGGAAKDWRSPACILEAVQSSMALKDRWSKMHVAARVSPELHRSTLTPAGCIDVQDNRRRLRGRLHASRNVLHIIDISAEPEDSCIDVAVHARLIAAVVILVSNLAPWNCKSPPFSSVSLFLYCLD
jgi:hypothetical protein